MRLTLYMLGGERHTVEVVDAAWDVWQRAVKSEIDGVTPLAWQQARWLYARDAESGWGYWQNMDAVQRIGEA